jgi:thioredoxin reductase (NADPH)
VLQAERYGVEMLQAVSVTSVTTDGEEVDVETATGDHYQARAALIASGSSYRRTGAPGEDDLIGAGIHFCATCDGPFYKGASELVVLGGGNSGLEEGLFLTQFVDRVTLVQRGDHLTANKLLQDKVAATPEMDVLLNREVVEFKAKDDGSGKLGAIVLKDRESGESEEIHPAGRVRVHRA